eukprot:TRINITY_DN56184_c0_g1_i1.p1 TRINITY_DN56184_c0_g1~~TRINITY_DN56184_c0_g1_i1.p1  ORF type:complete len:440 (+),score=111.27 TRINITY_DN56184_c0_g1_i1:77-1321(+)
MEVPAILAGVGLCVVTGGCFIKLRTHAGDEAAKLMVVGDALAAEELQLKRDREAAEKQREAAVAARDAAAVAARETPSRKPTPLQALPSAAESSMELGALPHSGSANSPMQLQPPSGYTFPSPGEAAIVRSPRTPHRAGSDFGSTLSPHGLDYSVNSRYVRSPGPAGRANRRSSRDHSAANFAGGEFLGSPSQYASASRGERGSPHLAATHGLGGSWRGATLEGRGMSGRLSASASDVTFTPGDRGGLQIDGFNQPPRRRRYVAPPLAASSMDRRERSAPVMHPDDPELGSVHQLEARVRELGSRRNDFANEIAEQLSYIRNTLDGDSPPRQDPLLHQSQYPPGGMDFAEQGGHRPSMSPPSPQPTARQGPDWSTGGGSAAHLGWPGPQEDDRRVPTRRSGSHRSQRPQTAFSY